MKISIIVPVYNAEKYLKTCVDSIIHQSYKDIEVILIDDGSTDSSGKICDRYAKLDTRVKVRHKENGGVSSARNIGMQLSSGDYVMFVDADDWLDEDACSKVASTLNLEADLYIYNLRTICGNNVQNYSCDMVLADKEEFIADIIFCQSSKNPYIRAVWGKAFSRKLIENLRFDEFLYIGEDACFLLECVIRLNIRQIQFVETTWYNYRIIPDSAVRKYKTDLLEQSIRQYQYIEILLNQIGQETIENVKNAMMRFSWGVAISLKANSMKEKMKSDDFQKWLRIAKDHLSNFSVERKELPKFHYLCSRIYRYCGGWVTEGVVWLYEVYKRII